MSRGPAGGHQASLRLFIAVLAPLQWTSYHRNGCRGHKKALSTQWVAMWINMCNRWCTHILFSPSSSFSSAAPRAKTSKVSFPSCFQLTFLCTLYTVTPTMAESDKDLKVSASWNLISLLSGSKFIYESWRRGGEEEPGQGKPVWGGAFSKFSDAPLALAYSTRNYRTVLLNPKLSPHLHLVTTTGMQLRYVCILCMLYHVYTVQ